MHCVAPCPSRESRVAPLAWRTDRRWNWPVGPATTLRRSPAALSPGQIVVSARLGAFPEHLAFSDQAGADDDLHGGKGGGPSSQVSCGPVGPIPAAIRPPREPRDPRLARWGMVRRTHFEKISAEGGSPLPRGVPVVRPRLWANSQPVVSPRQKTTGLGRTCLIKHGFVADGLTVYFRK